MHVKYLGISTPWYTGTIKLTAIAKGFLILALHIALSRKCPYVALRYMAGTVSLYDNYKNQFSHDVMTETLTAHKEQENT